MGGATLKYYIITPSEQPSPLVLGKVQIQISIPSNLIWGTTVAASVSRQWEGNTNLWPPAERQHKFSLKCQISF